MHKLTSSTGMSGCYSIYGFEYKPAREWVLLLAWGHERAGLIE